MHKFVKIQLSPYCCIICDNTEILLCEFYKNLTELAYHHGYYDQSHFINDFKTFTGESPKKILTEGDMFSDYFDT